jgi:hypothetical protein
MTRKDECDRYDAALAFLKGAFAGGPLSVAELEVKARASRLLGERQSITHAKLFRRAKRALEIRSIRDGFGAGGGWFWALPRDPGYSEHPSTIAVKAAQVSALDPQPHQSRFGVPREWIDGIAELSKQRAPTDVPPHRWLQFLDDCQRFLAIWGAKAADLGWNAEALFGCARTQPLAHLQVAGLIWALRGRKIVRLYTDSASIEDPADGSQHVFNRRHINVGQITLPWLLR